MIRNLKLLLLVVFWNVGYTQISTGKVPISETNSYNGHFILKSISFDDEFPNTRGISEVLYTRQYESFGVKKKVLYNRSLF